MAEIDYYYQEQEQEEINTSFNYEDQPYCNDDKDYYEEEYEEEPERVWPIQSRKVVRPPVEWLIKNSHKPIVDPKEPDAMLKDKYMSYKTSLTAAKEAYSKLEKQYEVVNADLEKEKNSGSTWSNRANREANLKRMNCELDLLAPKLKEAKKKVEEIVKANEKLVSYWDSFEAYKKMHADFTSWQYESWNKVYGPHTPITNKEQLLRYYEIAGEPEVLPSGLVRFRFKDEFKIGHAMRELKMGGIEVLREHWDVILAAI